MKFTLLILFAVVLASFAVLAQSPEPTGDAEPEPEPTIAYAPPPPPSTAAGHFDGYSKCQVRGFKLTSPVVRCCTQNKGVSKVEGKVINCRVAIGREGYYRKCIYDLHYPTSVTCRYY
ncbi:hypothetical protein DFQ26_007733 [Actinomortierella ambigua]|nr:hypothetical protein DFQ26_007733 [Actinomortierella ambigua]